MGTLIFLGAITGIGIYIVNIVLNEIKEKQKRLNQSVYDKHLEDLKNLDLKMKEISQYKDIRGYANAYTWDKFKSSMVTKLSMFFPIVASASIFFGDMPTTSHIFSVLIGLGMVGLSFWYYRMFKVSEIAAEGATEYLNLTMLYKKEYTKAEMKKLEASFKEIMNGNGSSLKVEKSLDRFNKTYSKLLHSVERQQVISESDKSTILESVNEVFINGVSVFKEIHDIMMVEAQIDLVNASDIMKERSAKNQLELKELFEVIKSLNDTLEITSLDIPNATSSKKSVDIAKSAISDLQSSMNQAVQVQENIKNMNNMDSNNYESLYTKYSQDKIM